MTSVIGDDFKDMASLISGSLKDETAQKANIMRSIKEIMATRLQYVKESKREDLEKRAAELAISSFSSTGLKDEYQNFLLRVIGVTETWERKAELLPVMIDSLLEQGLKDGILARSGQAEMNALVYAAYIGDIRAIERAKSLLGDKLPEQLNQGKFLPLGIALLQGQYEYAKALIAAGADVNARDDRYECLLHYVIRGKKPEVVEFLLQQEGVDVNAKDEYDHTSLHHAALMKDAQIVALLLKNNEIAAQKQERDIFGRTPLDIALQEKSDDLIRLLIDDPTVDVQTLPGYGIAPVKINQGHILDKLTERLALKKKQMEEQQSETTLLDPKEILIPGGHCNGLSLLMEYYSFKGKEEEFYSVMELFSTWDGTEESLKSIKGLEELSGGYKDLDDLMEQWTNDIIWFQQNYDVHFRQEERVPQLEMVRKSPLDKVTPATAIGHTFTQEQLAEWLQIRSYFPGTIIEFKGSGHNTTLKILPQSKGAYYDSNSPYRIAPFTSMERLASTIYRTKHLSLGKTRDKMREHTMIYRMYSGEKEAEPARVTPSVFLEQASPNGYSKMHFAILFNDIDLFNEEFAKQGFDANQVNAHGHSLLHDAIVFGREEMVKKLMDHPDIKTDYSLLNLAIQSQHENIAKILIEHGVEVMGSSFYEAFETNQREVVKAIIARKVDPRLINYASLPRFERPLHLAVYRRDKEMITLLLQNGADLKAKGWKKVGSILACIADIRDAEFLKFMVGSLSNLNETDEEGLTLKQHAEQKSNSALVALL